ncbi:hypothetical protein M0804_007140 [Polistes exclamans]|nr:hypothetical protein M0804_007140 [Polistes exclamans]
MAIVQDRSFLVANAQQGLCHIIYCSDGFCRLTGFSRAEVMQRPAVCEFLHGPMTSPHAVAALRDALVAGVEKHFEILYYRKDDTRGGKIEFINFDYDLAAVRGCAFDFAVVSDLRRGKIDSHYCIIYHSHSSKEKEKEKERILALTQLTSFDFSDLSQNLVTCLTLI